VPLRGVGVQIPPPTLNDQLETFALPLAGSDHDEDQHRIASEAAPPRVHSWIVGPVGLSTTAIARNRYLLSLGALLFSG
jgi:hypothetical protein